MPNKYLRLVREREGKGSGARAPIREMLYNNRYVGKIVWTRTRYVRVPGSNKRFARPRPPEEWQSITAVLLRVVPEEQWVRVHRRLE